MFVYKWPADKENDTGIVGQHSSCDVQGERGLSGPGPGGHSPLPVARCGSLEAGVQKERLGSLDLGAAVGTFCSGTEILGSRQKPRGLMAQDGSLLYRQGRWGSKDLRVYPGWFLWRLARLTMPESFSWHLCPHPPGRRQLQRLWVAPGPFVSNWVSLGLSWEGMSGQPHLRSLCLTWKLSTQPGPNSLLPLGGGISSYANDPSRAGQSLVECLEQALRDVPKDRHAGTPLYLGATAGMRLLK